MQLAHDPGVPSWALSEENDKTNSDTRTSTFTAKLFTIAETCKQPKCPSAERMSCIYIVKYYSSVTKNAILKPAITCTSDRRRQMLYDFTCMLNLKMKNK